MPGLLVWLLAVFVYSYCRYRVHDVTGTSPVILPPHLLLQKEGSLSAVPASLSLQGIQQLLRLRPACVVRAHIHDTRDVSVVTLKNGFVLCTKTRFVEENFNESVVTTSPSPF